MRDGFALRYDGGMSRNQTPLARSLAMITVAFEGGEHAPTRQLPDLQRLIRGRRGLVQLEALLELRHQRADELRRIVPVVRTSANEVMRHHGAGRLAPRQPRREQRALAHPRPAGHHDPALGCALDQLLIELGQQRGAPDEPDV